MTYLLHPITFYGGNVNTWMSTGGLREAEGKTPADAANSLKMHFRQSHAPIHSDERINAERVLGLAVDEFCHFYAVEEKP